MRAQNNGYSLIAFWKRRELMTCNGKESHEKSVRVEETDLGDMEPKLA